jgi:hypothetical protein
MNLTIRARNLQIERVRGNDKINKQERIKQVLQSLVDDARVNRFSRREIEKAILKTRGFDTRTVSTWFNALWKLEYFLQLEPGVYILNYSKIAELEVKLPVEVDPKQAKLGGFLK